jgi:pyrroloquinoline quinone biosynthesis protein D
MTERGEMKLCLSRHAALKARAEGDVLVLPERAIRIGGSGGEILRICEPGRTESQIVSEMRTRYPDSPEIEAEVSRFLSEMLKLGGLCESPTQEGNAE